MSMLLSALATAPLVTGPNARAAEIPYCTELRQIASLALAKGGFADAIGAPREGNFLGSKIMLAGLG
jgi:hypothetical protein